VDILVIAVSVVVDALVPAISTVDETSQDTGFVAFSGEDVTPQLRFTVPVNPSDGVTVIVAVLPVVAPADMAIAPLLLSAKFGGARRIVTVADWLVMIPLETVNVKLSEPDNSDGGEYVALPEAASRSLSAPLVGGFTIAKLNAVPLAS
jgi:hypothetical protein